MILNNMEEFQCKICGKCCQKHWLVKLSTDKEKEKFKDQMVFGGFMWTDLCSYLKDGKCDIHEEKPFKCKEYFCEGREM